MQALSGPNEFTEFYSRLKSLREFHRKHPNEVSLLEQIKCLLHHVSLKIDLLACIQDMLKVNTESLSFQITIPMSWYNMLQCNIKQISFSDNHPYVGGV